MTIRDSNRDDMAMLLLIAAILMIVALAAFDAIQRPEPAVETIPPAVYQLPEEGP